MEQDQSFIVDEEQYMSGRQHPLNRRPPQCGGGHHLLGY